LHFLLETVCIIPLFYFFAGSKVKDIQQSIYEALMLKEAVCYTGILQCNTKAEQHSSWISAFKLPVLTELGLANCSNSCKFTFSFTYRNNLPRTLQSFLKIKML